MSSYTMVVKNMEHEIGEGEDKVKKTYPTVVEVKDTVSNLSSQSDHHALDSYDITLIAKIYIDGKFYDTAADVPAQLLMLRNGVNKWL